MRFKTTAIAAGCLVLAPVVLAQPSNPGGPSGQGMTAGAKHETGTYTDMPRSARSSINSETVREIQQKLTDKGFDPGAVDGVMGPKTRSALHAFRQQHGMKGGAATDAATLSALGVDTQGSNGSMNRGAPMSSDTTRNPTSGSTMGTAAGAGGTTGSRAGTTGTAGTETPPATSSGSTTAGSGAGGGGNGYGSTTDGPRH